MPDDPWEEQRERIAHEHVDLDVGRIVECFARHDVEYLLVGGVAANLHGSSRPTGDLDSLPRNTIENLTNLAGALRELGAFLRVEGLTDDEARQLPTQIDALMLQGLDISTRGAGAARNRGLSIAGHIVDDRSIQGQDDEEPRPPIVQP